MRQLVGEDLRDQSFGDLCKQLSEQTPKLVPQEVELPSTELEQKDRSGGVGAGLIGAGGLLGLGALAAAVMSAEAGKRKVQAAAPPVPEQTVVTLKEDVQ